MGVVGLDTQSGSSGRPGQGSLVSRCAQGHSVFGDPFLINVLLVYVYHRTKLVVQHLESEVQGKSHIKRLRYTHRI